MTFRIWLLGLVILTPFIAKSSEMPTSERWTFNRYNQPMIVAKNSNTSALIMSEQTISLVRIDIKCDSFSDNKTNVVNLIVSGQPVKFVAYCSQGYMAFSPYTENGMGYVLFLLTTKEKFTIDELVFSTNGAIEITKQWQKMASESL